MHCECHSAQLQYTLHNNTAQNCSDNLPSYSPYNHHSPNVSYQRGRGYSSLKYINMLFNNWQRKTVVSLISIWLSTYNASEWNNGTLKTVPDSSVLPTAPDIRWRNCAITADWLNHVQKNYLTWQHVHYPAVTRFCPVAEVRPDSYKWIWHQFILRSMTHTAINCGNLWRNFLAQ